MPLLYDTVWSAVLGWYERNALKVLIAGLHSLFPKGCLDSQFLIISVSAQTTVFIPACDKMHSLKSMSEA